MYKKGGGVMLNQYRHGIPLKPLIFLCFLKKNRWKNSQLIKYLNDYLKIKAKVKYHVLRKHLEEMRKVPKLKKKLEGLDTVYPELKQPLIRKEGKSYILNINNVINNVDERSVYLILLHLSSYTKYEPESLAGVFGKIENELSNSDLLNSEKVVKFLNYVILWFGKDYKLLIQSDIDYIFSVFKDLEKFEEELQILENNSYNLIRPVPLEEGKKLIDEKIGFLKKRLNERFSEKRIKITYGRKLNTFFMALKDTVVFRLKSRRNRLIYLLRTLNRKVGEING